LVGGGGTNFPGHPRGRLGVMGFVASRDLYGWIRAGIFSATPLDTLVMGQWLTALGNRALFFHFAVRGFFAVAGFRLGSGGRTLALEVPIGNGVVWFPRKSFEGPFSYFIAL